MSLIAVVVVFRDGRRRIAAKPDGKKFKPPVFGAGAFALCVLMILSVWLVIRVPASMGDGPAGEKVSVQPFSKPWTERQVLMVSLGDSVSTGYGADEGMGYFDLMIQNNEESYPEMAGLDLSSVLPNLKVKKSARNASNSLSHLQTIRSMKTYPDDVFGIVCITTGGIDLIHNYGRSAPVEGAMFGASHETAKPWIANFEKRLIEMMTMLVDKFPGGCVVMLANIYDPTDGVGDIENAGPMFWLDEWPDGLKIHAEFNSIIAHTARAHNHVHLVDMYGAMLGHGIHCQEPGNPYYDDDDPTYWYYINLEDPNRRGYDSIRRLFLNRTVDALRRTKGFEIPR
ncbi:SGNH/GDSL hydrolase family protein [Planctomycetota bacterium]|nr:SGNH/GDSL hydrolase family protein [Planctomycetota bacterium]